MNIELPDFPASFEGPVLRPHDAGFAEARSIFNMRYADKNPAVIARAAHEEDVVTAVRYASNSGIPIAVRSGGHGVDGTSMPEGALVIDTSLLKRITVEGSTARLEAGVLLGEMDSALAQYGLAVPSGTVSTTGVAGLTLGGGVGHLMRRYGATVDNLLACELITVDGRKVRASAQENEELFWALRGAGANLGVVTAFEFQGRPIGPEVTSGLIPYSIDQAPAVLHALAEHMRTAPRELGIIASLAVCPPLPAVPEEAHGKWVLQLVVVYTGDPARADAVVTPLTEFGRPLANLVTRTSWPEANRMLDVIAPFGRRCHSRGGYITELSDDVIAATLNHLPSAPAPAGVLPPTATNFWCLGGAISEDYAEDSVAFSREGAGWFWETVGLWEGPENDEIFVRWVDDMLAALKPHLRSNGYVNLSTDQGAEWLRGLYGSPTKYQRLEKVKTEWDPHNLLRFQKNIQPVATSI